MYYYYLKVSYFLVDSGETAMAGEAAFLDIN